MGQQDWGGGVDYSGLFADLAQQFENDVEEATERSIARSQEEQAAEDAEKYDQWKNGLISDEQWLKYLKQRMHETKGDPKEHQSWVETYREHQSAIQDAQMEADFATGDVSIHRLIAHYQTRMKGVKKNSPAYREWAARYAQLVESRDAQAASLSGAGGSGGGGSRSYWPRGFKPADGGGRARRGNAEGPVDPINTIAGFKGFDQYMDGLFGDLDRIDAINAQIEAGNKVLTDPLTGEQFEATPDVIKAIDRQYLRTQDLVAAGKWADGDRDGATQALKYRSAYIETVQKHNSMAQDEVWDEAESTFFAGVVAGSQLQDPEKRAEFYAELQGQLQKVADKILVADTATVDPRTTKGVDDTKNAPKETIKTPKGELGMVDPEMLAQMETTLKLAQAWGDPSLSLDQRMGLMSDVMDNRPEGYRLDSTQLQEFADGNVETGQVGAIETHVAREGLAQGTHRFYFDGQSMRVATPEEVAAEVGNDEASGTVNFVETYQRINGRNERVLVKTLPVESDLVAYEYTEAAGEGAAGKMVPSSEVNKMTRGQLQNAMSQGLIQAVQVTPPWRSVVMPDGTSWFEDPETGLWYDHHLPVNISRDSTGALYVEDDGSVRTDFSRFASNGGVFLPFAGVSANEMQKMAERDIAAGFLNPADYAIRDEFGEAQPGVPDVAGMYWNPAERNAVETDRELHRLQMAGPSDGTSAFVRRQESKIRVAANEWVRQSLAPSEQKLMRDMDVDPVQHVTQQMAKFGERLGISLMTPEMEKIRGGFVGQGDDIRNLAMNRGVPQGPSLEPVRPSRQFTPRPVTGPNVATRVLTPPIRLAKVRSVDVSAPNIGDIDFSSGGGSSRPLKAADNRRLNFREY